MRSAIKNSLKNLYVCFSTVIYKFLGGLRACELFPDYYDSYITPLEPAPTETMLLNCLSLMGFAQVSLNYFRVGANFSRGAFANFDTKIQHHNPVSNIHDQTHIVFN